ESELFGHEKGAFTGAVDRRMGKFELANRGTLLLDEISEMDYSLQAKLLRAIQEREVDRIGGRLPIPVDVRVIATTNCDLLAEVKNGHFREDLYYRLNVFPLKLPPLRERRDDIIPLAEFFLKKLAAKMGKHFSLSDELKSYIGVLAWEGNARELENFIYRTAVISPAEVLRPPAEGEGLSKNTAAGGVAKTGTIKDMERELIIETLRKTGGNRTKAAELLGKTVRTVRNKIKEHTIREEEYKGNE
ncbi:MAG TPA: sigma 54-interacting transcriptional regulator, partial [Dissulfurispiraceae bacterium]|nr:sigma 54-interacting transcriptional regulator [Dissulfurispiraceae bacterium]